MPKTQVFKIQVAFNLYDFKVNKNNIKDKDEVKDSDLVNISERLHKQHRNFFNIYKAKQQLFHQSTDHIIDLKLNTELPYMHTYNMFSAELKALDSYLNKALIKD